MQDYVVEYEKLWHKVVRVRLSRPISNDRHSTGPISWRYLVVMLQHVRLNAAKLRSALWHAMPT